MVESRSKPIFQINDWVEYTESEFPYSKSKGHIDQINWSEDDQCWFYIVRKFGFNSLISIPGNDQQKIKALKKI